MSTGCDDLYLNTNAVPRSDLSWPDACGIGQALCQHSDRETESLFKDISFFHPGFDVKQSLVYTEHTKTMSVPETL